MSANRSETPTRAVGAEEKTAEGETELGALLRAESLRSRAAAAAVVLGKIVAIDPEGTVRILLPGTPDSRPARVAADLSAEALAAAATEGRAAILAFEHGDPTLPIVMGLMRRTGPATDDDGRAQEVDARVDGRRMHIVAQDEIVLECGSASITLRRNGRVVIRGEYVETYSEGTNRIKGGQVRIN